MFINLYPPTFEEAKSGFENDIKSLNVKIDYLLYFNQFEKSVKLIVISSLLPSQLVSTVKFSFERHFALFFFEFEQC